MMTSLKQRKKIIKTIDRIEWQHLHHQQVKTNCGSLEAKLSQCQQDLEKMPSSCPACAEKTVANASPSASCDTPYFKKLARTILEHVKDYGSYEVTVTASKDDSLTLEKFVLSDKGNVQDVSEVITGILTKFKSHDGFDFHKWDTSTLHYLTREAILLSVAFILIICAVVIFEMRTNLSWRSQMWLVLLVSFIVSIPWEWYHLYRKAFASKQAQMAKANEIPRHCLPDHELRPWESFKLWFSSSFTFSDDICTRYQETLLVDPFWEVSPSKVSSFAFYSVQQLCFVYSYHKIPKVSPPNHNAKNPPLNHSSKCKPLACTWKIALKYKVKQSKNGKFTSNCKASPIDFEMQISLHR